MSTFATICADDVALDMDTEVGYITEDENDRSEPENDIDDTVYGRIAVSVGK